MERGVPDDRALLLADAEWIQDHDVPRVSSCRSTAAEQPIDKREEKMTTDTIGRAGAKAPEPDTAGGDATAPNVKRVADTAASELKARQSASQIAERKRKPVRQVVLVLQGGGALGAYQAGV